MSNKFNAPISLEKFSAFLDGNLPDSEMLAISQEIAKDDFLRSMVDANAETDEIMALNSDDIDLESIDESSFELPSINFSSNPKENFELSDIWLDSESSLSINEGIINENHHMVTAINESSSESSFVESNLESNQHLMKNKVNYGYEPNHNESTFDWNIYQGEQPSCAVRCQEIILRDYGIMIPQEELIQYATENGWYIPDGTEKGTPRDATGNILDAVGITTQRFDNASIYDIIAELRAGHRVIVSVDANELWVKNEPNLFKRLFGELNNKVNDKLDELTGVQGANHALIVAGVNVNPDNPSDMKVVLIDSGSGDVCIEYSFKDFKKAWDDSNHHMVATTKPAPFQYNYETHEMEPSNFQSDFMPSLVNLPAGLHNQFELPDTYFNKYGNLEPEYSWNHVVPFLEKWDEENHAQREHLVASSTNSSHEEDDSHTSDELSEGNYTSYENDDDSVDSSSEEDTSSHSYHDEDDTYEPESDQMDNGNPSDFDDESDF